MHDLLGSMWQCLTCTIPPLLFGLATAAAGFLAVAALVRNMSEGGYVTTAIMMLVLCGLLLGFFPSRQLVASCSATAGDSPKAQYDAIDNAVAACTVLAAIKIGVLLKNRRVPYIVMLIPVWSFHCLWFLDLLPTIHPA
jgi:hypothetical protein